MSQQITLTPKGPGWECRFRIGTASGIRRRVVIQAPDEETARTRAMRLRTRLDALIAAGRQAEAVVMLTEAAAQRTERGFAAVERAMRDYAGEAQQSAAQSGPRTFHDVLEIWLSGELRRRFPDVCAPKGESSTEAARYAYNSVIAPILGQMPIREITLIDAERVKAAVAHLNPSTRRKYETIVRMCLEFAVYPLRLIDASPIPRKGFVARAGKPPQFQFIYPAEEARLVGDTQHALIERAYLAWMFRNGGRAREGLAARWRQIDFTHGGFTLPTNKTGDYRVWRLDDDVLEAMRLYRGALEELGEDVSPEGLLFPGAFPKASWGGGAISFRQMLQASGVTREELFNPEGNLARIRLHDTRATFCTLALAAGRSEQWVMDRTGHTTSAMLERYRRRARTARDFALGWFGPMAEELRFGAEPKTPSGTTETPSVDRGSNRGGSYVPEIGKSVSENGGALMCSDVGHAPGQTPGQRPPFEPKKTRAQRPTSGPSRRVRTVPERENAADLSLERPGAARAEHDGPVSNAGAGPVADPAGRQILIDAIAAATAAGNWAIVAQLARVLDGEPVAAAVTR